MARSRHSRGGTREIEEETRAINRREVALGVCVLPRFPCHTINQLLVQFICLLRAR